jgi:hypothetical protein
VGPLLTPDEAMKILRPFGKIKSCYTASELERIALKLNEGVMVSFEMYDVGQVVLNVKSTAFTI